jgi:hypothetical protein
MYIMKEQKTLDNASVPDHIPFDHDPVTWIPGDDYIIFPTVFLSDHYKKQLVNKKIPHNPDRITTLLDFCRKYHDEYGNSTRIISDVQALIILTSIIERIKADIPFFFNRGNPSPGTIKDLYALRSVISQRSIDFASHPLVGTSEKCRQISLALAAYEKSLTDNHFLDTSALFGWTIQDITSRTGTIFGSVIVHGLYDILPREKRLIQVIRDHAGVFRYEYHSGKDSDVFFPPDWIRPEELVPIEPRPGYESRYDIFTTVPDQKPDDHIRTRIFSSTTDEFEAIAEEIHTFFEEGTPLEDIAIAFPSISSVLPSLQEVLDDFGIPFHAFAGEPLIREPIIGFLLLFPSLVMNAYPREKVMHLISSPYFYISQKDLPRISVADFDRVVRTAGIEGGYSWDEPLRALKNSPETGEYYRSPIPDDLVDCVLTWITAIQTDCNQFIGAMSPSGFKSVFQQLCMRWVRPKFRISRAHGKDPLLLREIQAYRQFQGCLTRLSSLFDSRETGNVSLFWKFLIFLLEEPVNLTQDYGGVRIMGLRQTMGMKYSCLFIGGLVEGDIPSPSTRFPLLTSPESEQLGSRRLDEVIRGEQYYFMSTLAAGKNVLLSAPKTRGERKMLTSSFFERVRLVKSTPEWGRNIIHSRRRAAIRAGKSIGRRGTNTGNCPVDSLTWLPAHQTYGSVATRILIEDWYRTMSPDTAYDGILAEDDEVITWLSDPKMFGLERIWSPTQLETYAHCPFRFYLERVVRVDPLPDAEPALSPSLRGSLIHETLYEFYSRWCAESPRRVNSRDLPEATVLLATIGREMSGRYRYQSPVWHATMASLLGFDGIPGIYERYLLFESRKETTLRPELFEVPIGTDRRIPGGTIEYVLLESDEGDPVRIQGRIDRVDTTPDGQFTIIDYKTGSNYPNGQRIVEGKALQLPLYLLALEKMYENDDQPKTGIGGSYIEINIKIRQSWPLLDPEKKPVAGALSPTKGTPGFREVIRGSLAAAQQYITDIRSGKFPVTRDTCMISSYCPYSGICRINRFRMTGSEDGGTG